MALDEFFGCLLTSFGIPGVLILYTVLLYPLRIITFITSAAFWLLSLLISSILWFAVVPLHNQLAFGLVFSVIFQELMRFAFVHLLHKVDAGIRMISSVPDSTLVDNGNQTPRVSVEEQKEPQEHGHSHSNSSRGTAFEVGAGSVDGERPLLHNPGPSCSTANVPERGRKVTFEVTTFAYVGGLGFGVMSGLLSSLDLLTALVGPGTLGLRGQKGDFVALYSCQVLFVILSHTAYGVIMSKAYQKKSILRFAVLVILHMATSCLTLVNQSLNTIASIIVLTINGILCILVCAWAFLEAGGHVRRLPLVVRASLRFYGLGPNKQRSSPT